MKLFSNTFSAAILLSPFVLGFLVYGYIWIMAYREKVEGRSIAIESCKENYKTGAHDAEVSFQDIVLQAKEYDLGAEYEVSGIAIYKDKNGSIKKVKMSCIISH